MRKPKLSYLARAAMILLLAVLGSTGAWAAASLSGSGTQSDPYMINSDADWETFVDWINNQNSTYGNKYYKLGDDINVSTMVGTSGLNTLHGEFDGDGHTITLDLTTSNDYCGLFRYARATTIRRLHVAGTITTSAKYAGGLIGISTSDDVHIYNCWSSVTINSSYEGDTYDGGFVGYADFRIYLTNCRFDGSLLGSNSRRAGGFMGYNSYTSSTITNCLFAPTSITMQEQYSNTISGNSPTIRNCYYTQTFGDEQGTAVGTMSNDDLLEALGSNWEIKDNRVVPIQDAKNLSTGSIECNSFFPYTGSEINVVPTVKDMDGEVVDAANYTVSFSPTPVKSRRDYTMTITGINGYTGTLTHAFTVAHQLDGSGTEDDPYTITTEDDWNTLAQAVAGGYSYEGEYVKLDDDITVSTMVGDCDGRPFRGTFDGNNHTLTANIVSTATGTSANEQGVAPFHYINRATIKNLTVAGTITSASLYAGGLVGWSDGTWSNRSYITDCVVTATITTSSNYAGGFVGNIDIDGNYDHYIEFTNCVFAGTIQGTDSETRSAGGFIGYGYAYSYFTNCLENGTYTNFSTVNPRCGETIFYNNTINSLYYVNKMGNYGNYVNDTYGCHEVVTTLPADDIYLQRTIKGYTFYQSAAISGLNDSYPYNNGETVSLGYVLKMGNTTMTEGTDYEVTYSPAALAAVGDYTVTFTAKGGNAAGYAGSTSRTFSIIAGENLDGYVFATEGEDENKVYLINNEADLERLAAYVNSGHTAEGKTFKLNATFTCEGTHTPIGTRIDTYYYTFYGTFDGNHNTISNLQVNLPDNDYVGLFGYVKGPNAMVKDLTLSGCQITGKKYVGGIAGYTDGNGSDQRVAIQNCHVSGTIAATVEGAERHGGIVGLAERTNISNCTVAGTISTVASCDKYGGIVGYAYDYVSVASCENAADITGGGDSHGGIVGYNNASNNFSQCLNIGRVEGTTKVGGIAGRYYTVSSFTNCFYASPCNANMALGDAYDSNSPGRAERAYTVSAGTHVTSITIAEDPTITSTLTNTKYYKQGNWTLTFTLEEGYSFVNYVCEGGTISNPNDFDAEHVLTIAGTGTTDVTISATMSNANATSIAGATIAAIPEQRWKGTVALEPALSVTYDESTLVEGTDYILEFTNNIAIGEATAKLTGINDYTGTKSINFTIADFHLKTPGSPNSNDNPYLIETEADLEALACIVNGGTRNSYNDYYVLNADIDCEGTHTPIGIDGSSFRGNFNGKNDNNQYTISGLKTTDGQADYQGLFGFANNATISNVVLTDCDITGKSCVGGIVGYCLDTYIYDCSVSGVIQTANDVEGYYHGGIAGYSRYRTISGCTNSASVTANNSTCTYYGGISGYYSGSNSYSDKIENCFNAGTVEGTSCVGSIAGSISGTYTLTNNYHVGTTTGGVGAQGVATGTDRTGAEIVAEIKAGDYVTLNVKSEPTKVWNNKNLYKSGVVVELDFTMPTGKVFDVYTVTSGEISNAGFRTGEEHTLTGFTSDVEINGTYADNYIDLTNGGAIATIPSLTYNGQEQSAKVVVTYNDETLVENANYTVSYSEKTNAGSHTATVTGMGRFQGELTKGYVIEPFDISADGAIAVSGVEAKYLPTGTTIHPVPTSVTCAATNNATLSEGTDYVVSYSDGCTSAGLYEVTLTGGGNYTGEVKVPFAIVDASMLTVYDGTTTNNVVPVYGFNVDSYTKSEMVMPAANLTAMTGKAICTMKFYLSTKSNYSLGNARFRVYMKEVESTSISSFSGTDNATIVYDGALDCTQDVMTIYFSTPYIYNGGNLLIGVYQYQKGTYRNVSFYGETVSGASIGDYAYNPNSVSATQRNFLPKTTFWYESNVPVDNLTAGIRTYASAYPLDLSSVNAYVVSAFDNENATLTLAKVDEAPANTGLLLKVANDDQKAGVTLPIKADATLKSGQTTVTTNYLKPVVNATTVQVTENGNTNFILANGSYGINWYKLEEAGVISANKAYLSLPIDPSDARSFTWIYEDATGIDAITREPLPEGSIYDLQGRRITQPTKGLYIVNGKKVFIKK